MASEAFDPGICLQENQSRSSPEKRKSSSSPTNEPQKKKILKDFRKTCDETEKNIKNTSVPAPIKISIGSKPPSAGGPLKMAFGVQKNKEPVVISKASVASAFNDSDEDEEEEMPPEAKMRMRNIGRETPTAAGPNSFGKGKLGFCDRQKILEKQIRDQLGEGE